MKPQGKQTKSGQDPEAQLHGRRIRRIIAACLCFILAATIYAMVTWYVDNYDTSLAGLLFTVSIPQKGTGPSAVIEPAEAYGEYDPKLVTKVPRDQFDPDLEIKVGMAFQASSNAGPVVVHVTKVDDKEITVDANHELAGKTLCFDVEVKDVANASLEQVEAGSVYTGGCGCGGGCSCGSCGGGCGGDCDGDCGDDGCGGEGCGCGR